MSSDKSGPQSVYSGLVELQSAPPPRERADAARNRAAVLDAAARLFADRGVDGVTMDAVAAAAGVGKGTVFRRFGDKSGLAVALLDERERELQEAILFGPAPLGPGDGAGAAPGERLAAFVEAYLDYALGHLDLLRMSETASPGARYRIGAYRFWHRHVTLLLAAARPDADAEALAHVTLAPLAAEHLRAMVAEVGVERTRAAVHAAPAP
ncbi:TetR/AcrR family transcriptional regulator [Jiangella muralis]|uniref:TetR/AcrR family transcriptional regulator n=1 Tax=Jiangella muralis TaxID=702383 RepID=UPI000A96BB42|nr:TetR/AcrR family transcriptional regulator [Jiangella muralis]